MISLRIDDDRIETACLATENDLIRAVDRVECVLCIHRDAAFDEFGFALPADTGTAIVVDANAVIFRNFENGFRRRSGNDMRKMGDQPLAMTNDDGLPRSLLVRK